MHAVWTEWNYYVQINTNTQRPLLLTALLLGSSTLYHQHQSLQGLSLARSPCSGSALVYWSPSFGTIIAMYCVRRTAPASQPVRRDRSSIWSDPSIIDRRYAMQCHGPLQQCEAGSSMHLYLPRHWHLLHCWFLHHHSSTATAVAESYACMPLLACRPVVLCYSLLPHHIMAAGCSLTGSPPWDDYFTNNQALHDRWTHEHHIYIFIRRDLNKIYTTTYLHLIYVQILEKLIGQCIIIYSFF